MLTNSADISEKRETESGREGGKKRERHMEIVRDIQREGLKDRVDETMHDNPVVCICLGLRN